MPYDIKRGVSGCSGYAVVVSTTGKRVGCHPTKSAAEWHQRALYANVPEARGKALEVVTTKEDAFYVAQRLLIDSDFWDSYERQLVETVRPLFETIFFAGMRAAIKLPAVREIVAGNVPDELTTTKAVSEAVRTALANIVLTGRQVVESMMTQWASGIASTTKDNILSALTRAREQSLGSPYVYDRIKADFSPARARAIAVTETTRFFGAGSVAVYRAAELPAWEWQTVEDGLVCPICSDLSGTQFRVAADFGPAHPRCRCFPKPVTDLSDREQVQEWEPTMSLEDAERWAADSVIKDTMYHVTSRDAAELIKANGFIPSVGSYGEGIYVTSDPTSAAIARTGNAVLRVKVRVLDPITNTGPEAVTEQIVSRIAQGKSAAFDSEILPQSDGSFWVKVQNKTQIVVIGD